MKIFNYYTIFSILILSLILASCKNQETHVLEVYTVEDMYRKVKIVDTACENQQKKAYSDIKNGKLSINIKDVYIHKPYTDLKKIAFALKKYNIILDTKELGEEYDNKGNRKIFMPNCYHDIMNREVNKILDHNIKKTIVDSIEKEFVLNHPDKIYSGEECDSEYESGEFAWDMDKNRFYMASTFQYPENYINENYQKASKTTASFILYKDGTIKNISVKTIFKNPANRKFTSYFEKTVTDLVTKALWKPATSAGLPVNAKINFDFYHK